MFKAQCETLEKEKQTYVKITVLKYIYKEFRLMYLFMHHNFVKFAHDFTNMIQRLLKQHILKK